MRIIKHFFAEFSIALHHLGGDELVVEDAINAPLYHALVVSKRSRVDHVVDYHVGEDVGKHGEH